VCCVHGFLTFLSYVRLLLLARIVRFSLESVRMEEEGIFGSISSGMFCVLPLFGPFDLPFAWPLSSCPKQISLGRSLGGLALSFSSGDPAPCGAETDPQFRDERNRIAAFWHASERRAAFCPRRGPDRECVYSLCVACSVFVCRVFLSCTSHFSLTVS
jgi:hypothetical protein